MLTLLADTEDIYLEPSALAGMYGPCVLENRPEFADLAGNPNTTHLIWSTGGNLVPTAEMQEFYQTGK